jgi:hypothetical protein
MGLISLRFLRMKWVAQFDANPSLETTHMLQALGGAARLPIERRAGGICKTNLLILD